uniref:Uncharacterized protein n=1 Tax=Heterorhabditis bacteriophora TaxID=37862 RepID=A0A1I7WZG1_HETBA
MEREKKLKENDTISYENWIAYLANLGIHPNPTNSILPYRFEPFVVKKWTTRIDNDMSVGEFLNSAIRKRPTDKDSASCSTPSKRINAPRSRSVSSPRDPEELLPAFASLGTSSTSQLRTGTSISVAKLNQHYHHTHTGRPRESLTTNERERMLKELEEEITENMDASHPLMGVPVSSLNAPASIKRAPSTRIRTKQVEMIAIDDEDEIEKVRLNCIYIYIYSLFCFGIIV